MAPFVSRQLIQHLVTGNPSPAYVQLVSSVFSNDGSGVAGDLKAVITAILTDPEARTRDDPSAAVDPGFGHLREPVLFLANLLRAFNASFTSSSTVYNQANLIGQAARASLALPASSLTPVNRATGAPHGFHSQLAELASLFSSKELAVVANLGSLVQPLTRAQYQTQQGQIPSNLFSSRPATAMADPDRARQRSKRVGRPGGRLRSRAKHQFGFPTHVSFRGRKCA